MALDVWPEKLRINPLGNKIATLNNPDIVSIKQELIDILLEKDRSQRETNPLDTKAAGGQKIRNLMDLGSPVFQLINERAKALFMHVNQVNTAVVDDCWANVYGDGEYAMPHCHKRCQGSVVFSLLPTPSEIFEEDNMSGQFYIMDPRVPQCCPVQKGYATMFLQPFTNFECVFVTFPGAILHGVTPHSGDVPRITIAWNINEKAIPGEVTHDGVPRTGDITPD